MSPQTLLSDIQELTEHKIQLIIDKKRSVAGSWNEGIKQSIRNKDEFILIINNDVILHADAIDRLIKFGEQSNNYNTLVWGGLNTRDHKNINNNLVNTEHSPDFCCFMIRPWTIVRCGMFDENFKPAYYEDNDYYVRVVLSGGDTATIHAVKYFHDNSMTVRTDGKLAGETNTTFGMNSFYFTQKWGSNVVRDRKSILRNYYKHPWDNSNYNLSWWPR